MTEPEVFAHYYDDCPSWQREDFIGYTPAEVTCLECLEDMRRDKSLPDNWEGWDDDDD